MTLDDYIVSEENTILETLDLINRNTSKTAFVCRGRKLIGVISDGDIRRAILKGVSTDAKIKGIVNYSPIYLPINRKREADILIKSKQINAVPIIDEEGNIVDVEVLLKGVVGNKAKLNIPVVIMAGGKGTRLKPYTNILPKPLIPVGEKTITEHIMDHFREYGCNLFFMIVNYKKEFIKAYFSGGKEQEIDVVPRFIDEKEFLGTGGGISLLEGHVESTFFLTNCDIIIDADYEDILKKHREKGNIVTMVCAKKAVTIPYGTIETDALGQIKAIKEKPVYEMVINTGFYLIEPDFLAMVPKGTKVDITDIIEKCVSEGYKVGTYIIDESNWMDMGQLEELARMKERMGLE